MNFGTRDKLAIEVGDKAQGDLREVNIWAANTLLTCIDNMAYLPQFSGSLEHEMKVVESGSWDDESDGFFFTHGPTTDNIIASINFSGSNVGLSFELVNGPKVGVLIEREEFCKIYKSAYTYLGGAST